jgi:hypothetical protein
METPSEEWRQYKYYYVLHPVLISTVQAVLPVTDKQQNQNK